MADMVNDDRFSHLPKDPRFRRMPKNERKVKIDKRFKDMFTDKRFKLKYSVDKRGRPINTTTNENLKKYYELSDEDEFDSEEESEDEANIEKLEKSNKNKMEKETLKEKGKSLEGKTKVTDNKDDHLSGSKNCGKEIVDDDDDDDDDEDSINEEDDSEEESEDEKNLDIDQDNLPDFARGEGNLESSSDEDDMKNGEDDDDDDDFEHKWGEFDKDVPEAKELSCRLAVCNMDWDRIKAQDLFVIMNSFLPSGGTIKAVTIYPSEFGLQRMKEEATKGPIDLIMDNEARPSDVPTTKEEDDSSDAEDFEGGSYHRERLRQYQLNRLKYFYAVVTTDSKETANHIYEECDGMEYESSSAKLDLRFIPDDMTFDQEPKSVCTEIPHSSGYTPSLFCTTALAQSKVDLTWDETDKDRIKVTMRDHKKAKGKNAEDLKEDDFKAYLASSSDEEDPYSNLIEQSDDSEESDEDKQIEKYKSLLQTLKESESKKDDRDVEMEVSWEPGLKEATEKIIKKKQEAKGQTAWEKYLTKRKEIKQEKREEKKKMKQKIRQQRDDSSDENEIGSSDEAAFSDDSIPDEDPGSPLYNEDHVNSNSKQGGKNKKKKKKKVKNETELTEEEKSREAELSLLMMDKDDDGRKHFSLKSIMEESKKGSKKDKKKKKKKLKEQRKSRTEDDDFEMDVSDKRFSALYDSHLFNIDPSAPEFKRTKGVEAIIDEKLKRRKSEKRMSDKQDSNKLKRKADSEDMEEKTLTKVSKDSKSATPVTLSQKDVSLASLVKSVKNKTQAHYVKKKKS